MVPVGEAHEESERAQEPRLSGVWGFGGLGGFRVQGSGFRVQGSGFRVQGSGFRGQGFRV